jgi:hypothetical protein
MQNIKNFIAAHKRPLIIGGLILLLVIGFLIWQRVHPPQAAEQPPAPVYQTYDQSHSADGIQQAAEQSGLHLDLGQQKEIVQDIQDSDTSKPNSVVQTTGAQLASAVKTEQVKSGADFTIVSPAKSSGTTNQSSSTALPVISANTPVTLNQYNIKAYPDRLLEVSAYGDGSGDIAYESKVKVLGMQGYVGPVVKYDPNKTNKVTVGARITISI